MAEVPVEITFIPVPAAPSSVSATTDAAGRFSLSFDAVRPLHSNPAAAGQLSVNVSGFDHVIQFVGWGTTDTRRDLTLRLTQSITAGHSAILTVDASSSACFEHMDHAFMLFTRQCGQLRVLAPVSGTLLVEARPLQDPGAVAIVLVDPAFGRFRGFEQEPGKASLRDVQPGNTYHLFIGAPEGAGTQTYEVTAFVVPPASATGQRR